MRIDARRDANERAIIDALERVGAIVEQLAEPVDLSVGWGGRIFLLEVKDGSKPPSRQKLTKRQAKFIPRWQAKGLPVYVVKTVDDALQAIGVTH